MPGRLRLLVLVVALSLLGLLGAPPAQACACGGFAAADGEKVAANAEYAALTFDGTTERVILSMNALTTAKDAALLIPTPQRATADLAEPTLFTELAELTAPQTIVRWRWWPQLAGGLMAGAAPGSGAGAPVTVLETKQLGDLEVTSLAATDADALTAWLDQNGYVLSDGLAAALPPYVGDGWYFTAIKLTTDAADLSGALQPLDLRFAADELVYPMRLSVAAQSSQFVRTYVFADHRTERTDPTAGSGNRPQLRFAGRLDPSAVTTASLAAILTEHPYLTATDQFLGSPATEIVSDFTFGQASSDRPYRRTIYVTRTRTILGAPAGPALVVLGWVGVNLAVAAFFVLARRRRRSTP